MRKNLSILYLLLSIFSAYDTQGQAINKSICITVDDLPANSTNNSTGHHVYITTRILEALHKYRVPAIGFVNENKLFTNNQRSPEREALLKAWFNKGLELGNHAFSHMDYNNSTIEDFENDIIKGEEFTNELFKSVPNRIKYFRHPYLHSGNTPAKKEALSKILLKHNYVVAPVTVDNSDWIFARAYDLALDKKDSAMAKRIGAAYLRYMMEKLKYFESQSHGLFNRNIAHILLIHANTINADYLPDLLLALKQYGYEFASLVKTLDDPAYTSSDTYAGSGGISWIHRWAITQGKSKEFFANEPTTPAYILAYAGINSE